MQRRHFLPSLGALALTANAAPAAPRLFLLQQYFLKNGTQGARLAAWLKDGLLAATQRLALPGPKLVLEALVAPHMPQVAVLTPYDTFEQIRDTRRRLAADPTASKAFQGWESGDEQPYEHLTETLLESTPYAPALPAPSSTPAAPRVYELRVYHSPSERQLAALHERFAGPEIQIFHRCGINPILYSSTLVGAQMPNLTYLTPFADLAAREKAWSAFSADPEWVKVRAESIAKSGQISQVSQISLFKAAAYSPIK